MNPESHEPTPRPPKGLGGPGRAFWRAVAAAFELEPHEAELLMRACKVLDVLDELDAAVTRDGAVIDGRVSPALIESRQQSVTFGRLVAALRLPDEKDVRPQRRSGSRGFYQRARAQRDRLIAEQRDLRVVESS